MEAIDVIFGYKEVDELTKSLNSIRTSSVSKVYMRVVRISASLCGDGFSFTRPRVVRRQIHRNNVQASTVENYYQISLYNEFVSHVINEMKTRFLSNENHSVGLLNLLPIQQYQIYQALMYHIIYHLLLISISMIYHFLLCFPLSMGCGLENGGVHLKSSTQKD